MPLRPLIDRKLLRCCGVTRAFIDALPMFGRKLVLAVLFKRRPLWPKPPRAVRLPSVWLLSVVPVRAPSEPILGRTLPTVARDSELTPERLTPEPRLKFGDRRPPSEPLMFGDRRKLLL